MMKKLTPVKLGLTFAGCFLGAGYVSGQELWQFFGSFGLGGILGMVLAVLLLGGVTVCLLRLAQEKNTGEADKLVIPWNLPALKWLMSALELVFLFGICTIMTAGVSALMNQLFGIPSWISGAVFALLVGVTAYFGLSGIVSAFSVSVPVLVIASIGFGIYALSRGGAAILPRETFAGSNPMMPVWLIGAVTFANYNIFGSFAILSPFAEHIQGKKTVYTGIFIGVLLLLFIGLGVLCSMLAFPEVLGAQLPMLALASELSPVLGYGYGVLLLMAMFGTSLSSAVAFIGFIGEKSESIAKKRRGVIGIYAVLMFLASLVGFGDLVGTVYPVFGYCSTVFVVLLIIHCIKVMREKKRQSLV